MSMFVFLCRTETVHYLTHSTELTVLTYDELARLVAKRRSLMRYAEGLK